MCVAAMIPGMKRVPFGAQPTLQLCPSIKPASTRQPDDAAELVMVTALDWTGCVYVMAARVESAGTPASAFRSESMEHATFGLLGSRPVILCVQISRGRHAGMSIAFHEAVLLCVNTWHKTRVLHGQEVCADFEPCYCGPYKFSIMSHTL